MTAVINIRSAPKNWQVDPAFVYIGREGHGLDGTYGNPHPIGPKCGLCGRRHTRADAIRTFEAEARRFYASEWQYRAKVERLRGRILVCFCKPRDCHGDAYLRLLGEGSQ